jgi:hypothetical protein
LNLCDVIDPLSTAIVILYVGSQQLLDADEVGNVQDTLLSEQTRRWAMSRVGASHSQEVF